MLRNLDKSLNKLYKFSGYIAATFLIFVAVFILIGISSRIFGFYIRGLAEYSGYCMASASFFALAYTFIEGGHIRITLFLEKLTGKRRWLVETWCLSIASFFSGYLAFYFIKMLIISYRFQERSEGADEILIWIPQTSVAIGSTIFFISVLLFFLGSGIWVALSMIGVSAIGMMLFTSRPVGDAMATTIWGTSSSWTLTALPLFVWMGEILFRTKLSENLFKGLSPWMQNLPGGLIHVNVVGCALFAAISGSSAATVEKNKKMSIPELRKRNYPEKILLGSLA